MKYNYRVCVQECLWYELHALTSNRLFSIGCQARSAIGAYTIIPKPGLSVAGGVPTYFNPPTQPK